MIVRQAVPQDAVAMTDLLNAIIRIGGTTAHERELSVDRITQYYITGPAVICCHVAVRDRRLIGFQSLDRNDELPDGWGDIGTFVAPDTQRSGAGLRLFEATCDAARAAGVATINATIRADNAPGLGYYTQRGFQDYATDPAFCLSDGRQVGRMSKRFDLD
jgi:GNAT superfamily N-acetyltransferase